MPAASTDRTFVWHSDKLTTVELTEFKLGMILSYIDWCNNNNNSNNASMPLFESMLQVGLSGIRHWVRSLPGPLLQQAFRYPKSRSASIVTVPNGWMVSRWCHSSQAGPWRGMSRLQPHWQIPTSQLLLLVQQLQLRLQLPGRKSNTVISQPHSDFSRSLSKHWKRSMNQRLTCFVMRDTRSLSSFGRNVRSRICLRGSQA